MSSKTTHARIDRVLISKKKTLLPDFTPNEVFKVGLNVLVGIDKTGKFIYGKGWKGTKK